MPSVSVVEGDGGGRASQHQRLGQQLRGHAPPGGTHRQAHGEVALSSEGPDHLQVGHVRARDEQ